MWGTSGYSDRNIGAARIERLSDLRWRGVDSIVSEVNFDVVWRRLVGLVAVGGGVIETGVLIDEDFAASGERIGRTRSSVDDSYLFYASADVGARALTWTTRSSAVAGYLDFLLGYQYWQERYLAFGATGFPGTVPSGVKALLNEYQWHSLRVKLQSAEGVDIAYTTEGAFRQRLREATSERHGSFVGVRWRF